MSKTYKTRPLAVRIVDRTDKAVKPVAIHDHRTGECDLPDSPAEQFKTHHALWIRDVNCYYSFESDGTGLCGCAMCTDRMGKDKNRKMQRAESRRLTRNWDEG